MSNAGKHEGLNKVTLTGLIITLGIVYGDIGTSPLYVVKAILFGLGGITPELIYGAISCVIWTLTIQTTLKYVIVTLRADNKGEGGIFALFALIKRRSPWAYFLAIIGGSTLLADGIITPSITVTSAIEGLKIINPNIPILPIVIGIILFLFIIQQFGTRFLGQSFGPMMFVWFSMLSIIGVMGIVEHPDILRSFNPYYAYKLLLNHPGGFLLLGAVFLATTGAEALYSDLGHCGIKNIRITWVFVKSSLILNYLGQGAWVIANASAITPDTNPFYAQMPEWMLVPGIIIATMAAIIASQALISGSFTLISEAISLNFWPKLKLIYPTHIKGQVYIPSINWFLCVSCLFVVLYFRESSNMEAAYGLSITITMLITTTLLMLYLNYHKVAMPVIVAFGAVFLSIEGGFLYANLFKFSHGGWFTILIAGLFCIIMYAWYNGRKIKNQFLTFEKIDRYLAVLDDLSRDETITKCATHLVFVTRANRVEEIESKIIYSILNKQPKRADVYWFLHVDVLDEPNTFNYRVTSFVDKKILKVDLRLGFKVEPKVFIYFRQVLSDLVASDEIDINSRYDSLRKHHVMGDFKFILIDRVINQYDELSFHNRTVMKIYEIVKKMGIKEVKALGLDTSNVDVEKVPLIVSEKRGPKISRVV